MRLRQLHWEQRIYQRGKNHLPPLLSTLLELQPWALVVSGPGCVQFFYPQSTRAVLHPWIPQFVLDDIPLLQKISSTRQLGLKILYIVCNKPWKNAWPLPQQTDPCCYQFYLNKYIFRKRSSFEGIRIDKRPTSHSVPVAVIHCTKKLCIFSLGFVFISASASRSAESW